jgi:hypothetical protein
MFVARAPYRAEITGTEMHDQGLIEETAASTLSCSRRIASSLSSRNIDDENDDVSESDDVVVDDDDDDDDNGGTAGMKEEDTEKDDAVSDVGLGLVLDGAFAANTADRALVGRK